jgi:hypothetical protein
MFQLCYSPTAFLKTDNLSEKVLCLGSKSTGARGANVQGVDVVVKNWMPWISLVPYNALYRKFEIYIPRNETAWPRFQFLQSSRSD